MPRCVALRYLYVLALVVWLGGMAWLARRGADDLRRAARRGTRDRRVLAGEVFGAILRRFHFVAYVAGAA